MARLTRNQQRLAKNLGLPTIEELKDFFNGNAEAAAEEVRLVLEQQLAQVVTTSSTGSLEGYTAVKENTGSLVDIILPATELNLSGKYVWAVTVLASPHHQALGLNVFNIIDSGRKRLPKGGPYPLFGLSEAAFLTFGREIEETSRILDRVKPVKGVQGFSVAQPTDAITPRRAEPRGQVQQESPRIFTQGPIRAVAGKDLYARALQTAKNRLKGSGFLNWDVVFVGATDG